MKTGDEFNEFAFSRPFLLLLLLTKRPSSRCFFTHLSSFYYYFSFFKTSFGFVSKETRWSRVSKKKIRRFYRNQRTFDNLIFDNTKKKHSPFHFELCDRLTTHRKYSWLHFVVSMIKNRNGVVFLQRFTGRNIKKKTVLIFLQVLRQNSFELLL